MKATGEQTIQHFKDCCKKQSKLFIPDSPRQESVADALADFYDQQTLFTAIEYFIKSRTGPFLVFDFAVESKSYTDRVVLDTKSNNKFKEIMEDTRKRMAE